MSWIRDLRKLHARDRSERGRLIEAFVCLGKMRVALWRLPFRRIAARLKLTQTEAATVPSPAQAAEAARIGWAVRTAASRTPWTSSCLVQALAGMVMLRRRNMAGTLYLGVAKDENASESIAAHAWLLSGGLFLVGGAGHERYRVISAFSNQSGGSSTDRMKNGSPRSHPSAEVRDGAGLCLSCGLCCSGEFGPHARIGPDEIDHAHELGLTVEVFQDRYHFRLPCPLYRNNGCSIYTARRPRICGEYQCRLLRKFLSGTISREHGLQIVRRTRELSAAVLNQMPAGGSWNDLQREMAQGWDSGRGLFGSSRTRQRHPEFFLAVASLKMYVDKHFGEPQGRIVP